MRVHMIAATDTGRLRERNEDAVATLPELGVAVLADGMGGHQAGDVASHIATDTMCGVLSDGLAHREMTTASDGGELLFEAVEQANAQILAAAAERPDYQGMGATLVAACFDERRFIAIHLGDSRLYRLRDKNLEQLTHDHSLVQELVRQGMMTHEEARASLHKNLITRALGIGEAIDPELTEGELAEGDMYLICSDGLTDVVSDADIEAVLIEGADDLSATTERLIAMANEAGGPDNISVVVVRVDAD
jgi:serine/threonine protein phosphatase PrpC